LSRTGIDSLFAQDLSDEDKAVVFATQGPINGAALGGELTQAAWHDRPTFYLIGTQDHAIPRVEQERMAARMGATIAHVEASHVPMLSQPFAVANFIAQAAAWRRRGEGTTPPRRKLRKGSSS
jgi:pimeloyl-ACP methyl ester carboxylesterase